MRKRMTGGGPGGRILTVVLLLGGCLMALAAGAEAKSINDKAGTTGFSFLKLGVGSKAVSMGGAFTGLADDPAAMYYNPAGTINLPGRQFMAAYHNYIVDIQAGYVAATFPLLKDKKVGFFVDYLNFGNFTRTDQYGVPTGEFSGGDIQLGGNVSANIIPELAAGINAKFISEFADGYSSEAIAFDLGLYYRHRDSLTTAGLCFYNLGGVLSGFSEGSVGEHKDKLPMGVRAGVAHSLRELPLVAALDVVYPNDNDLYVNAGLELYKFQPLYIRVGYSTFGENYKTGSGSEAWGGLAAGFGLDYKVYHISYAFMPYLDLGSSHRVTVSGEF